MSSKHYKHFIFPFLFLLLSAQILLVFYKSSYYFAFLDSRIFPYTHFISLTIFFVTTIVAGLFVAQICIFHRLKIRSRKLFRISNTALLTLLFASSFNFFFGEKGTVFSPAVHTHDMFHYKLGPKYYNELGLIGLYDFTAYVLEQENLIYNHSLKGQVRGLRVEDNYRMISFSESVKRGAEFRDNFSDARYKKFVQDINITLLLRGEAGLLTSLLRDHGYNGAPTNAILAGSVANLIPSSPFSYFAVTLIDIAAICAGLTLISFAFGWKVAAICAIILFTTPMDRFSYVGLSYFRYVWQGLLMAGIACLHLKRNFLAGSLIAVSALLNAFPVLFLVGFILSQGPALLKKKDFMPSLKFYSGVALSSFLLIIPSLLVYKGLDNYREFIDIMGIHTGHLSTVQVSLQYIVSIPHTILNASIDPLVRIPNSVKIDLLEQHILFYRAIAFTLSLLTLAACWGRHPVTATIFAGFSLLFIFNDAAHYYYGFICLLPLIFFHVKRIHFYTASAVLLVVGGALGFLRLSVLFAGYDRFVQMFYLFNVQITLLFTLGIASTGTYLLLKNKKTLKYVQLLIVLSLLIPLLFLVNNRERAQYRSFIIPQSGISEVTDGLAWDHKNNVRIRGVALIQLSEPVAINTFSIGHDNNDVYKFILRDAAMNPLSTHISTVTNTPGIVRSTFTCGSASKASFIEVRPLRGDGRYSVGGLIVNN